MGDADDDDNGDDDFTGCGPETATMIQSQLINWLASPMV